MSEEVYDPLKDPTSDGYAKVEKALDTANAAPPASDTERKSALGWIALIAVLGVIALIVAGVYSYKSHKAEVAKIEAAPVAGIPASEKPTITRRKVATKTIANNSSNTPQTVDLVPEKQVSKPVNSDGFTSEFDKKLVEFERKIPK